MSIEIRNLHIEYPDHLLFDNVSLSATPHEIIAIETKVLDGGTSLLKGIAGFLSGVSGQVLIDGVDLLAPTDPESAFKVGYVYEERGLLSIYNIYQNICLPLQFHTDMTAAEIAQEAHYVCDLLQIDDGLFDQHPHHLNDVQTRTVNLARALIVKPRLLLIDELEGGMSDEFLQDTMERLKERQRDHPMVVLITTASDIVMELADRVLKIENQDLVEALA